MSSGTEPAEVMEKAREALRRIRELLMSPGPDTLRSCEEPLRSAAEQLQWLRDHLNERVAGAHTHDGESTQRLRSQAAGLRRELSEVGALLHQAGGYYLGWARILLSASDAYTPSGDAAPLPAYPRLSVEA